MRRAEEALAINGSQGLPPLGIGVGINSGPMVVGNMGSQARFDYTVIGDNVNTAFRVDGQCKVYGVPIIADQSTVEACRDCFVFRILDLIRVKGRSEPTATYELVGEKTDQPEPPYITWTGQAFDA